VFSAKPDIREKIPDPHAPAVGGEYDLQPCNVGLELEVGDKSSSRLRLLNNA
jgi:hypothetical protein